MLFWKLRQNYNINIICNISGYLQSLFWYQTQKIYKSENKGTLCKVMFFRLLSINLSKRKTPNNFRDLNLSLPVFPFQMTTFSTIRYSLGQINYCREARDHLSHLWTSARRCLSLGPKWSQIKSICILPFWHPALSAQNESVFCESRQVGENKWVHT